MVFDELIFPYKESHSKTIPHDSTHVISIFDTWLEQTNFNSSTGTTSSTPPCLNPLPSAIFFPPDIQHGESFDLSNVSSSVQSSLITPPEDIIASLPSTNESTVQPLSNDFSLQVTGSMQHNATGQPSHSMVTRS